MEVNELRQCPIVTARELMYERFTNVAGPFAECVDEYILDDFHLTFTNQIEMSTLEAWLVDTGGGVTAIYSVIDQGVTVHVLLDRVQSYSEKYVVLLPTIITVASEVESVTHDLMWNIRALVAPDQDIQNSSNCRLEAIDE